MVRIYLIGFLMVVASISVFGQGQGLKFQELESNGISLKDLDISYRPAISPNSSLAVFKTEAEQAIMIEAYTKLFQDLSKFLSENNFDWEKTTRFFNRVYFKEDGTIDYFVYNFLGNEEDIPTDEKGKEYQRLLNLFIADYQIPITVKEKFAQCSPITYKL